MRFPGGNSNGNGHEASEQPRARLASASRNIPGLVGRVQPPWEPPGTSASHGWHPPMPGVCPCPPLRVLDSLQDIPGSIQALTGMPGKGIWDGNAVGAPSSKFCSLWVSWWDRGEAEMDFAAIPLPLSRHEPRSGSGFAPCWHLPARLCCQIPSLGLLFPPLVPPEALAGMFGIFGIPGSPLVPIPGALLPIPAPRWGGTRPWQESRGTGVTRSRGSVRAWV